MNDDEWALVQAEVPRAGRGGNKRTMGSREMVNGLMYVPSTVFRGVNVEIVRRCDTGKLLVLPKRWIVECTIA